MKSLSLVRARAARAAAAVAAAVAALALAAARTTPASRATSRSPSPTHYETHAEPARRKAASGRRSTGPTQFGDPQLPQLIDEALDGSPSIAQAQARIAKASSYIETLALGALSEGQRLATRGPANSIRPTRSSRRRTAARGIARTTRSRALRGISTCGARIAKRLRQAVSQEKAAEADMQQARVTLAASVASTYNQLARLYALRDIAQHEIAKRDDIDRITNGRVAAGLDTNVERKTAQGNLATSQSNLTELDGQITTTRYQLAALLGEGPDRGLQIANPIAESTIDVALPDNLPADLVSRRPDIVAARWQVDAATHDVKEAKAEFFPDINLAAGVRSRRVRLGPLPHGRAAVRSRRDRRSICRSSTPAHLRSQLKGRYADFDYDVANYNQTLINALTDVATQVAAIRSIDQPDWATRSARSTPRRSAYQLAVIRYKAGLSPQLQVLNADENRLATDQTVTNLQMKRRDQQIGLIKALGGGFDATSTNLAIDGSGETHAVAARASSTAGTAQDSRRTDIAATEQDSEHGAIHERPSTNAPQPAPAPKPSTTKRRSAADAARARRHHRGRRVRAVLLPGRALPRKHRRRLRQRQPRATDAAGDRHGDRR